jgi:hypothetical protein
MFLHLSPLCGSVVFFLPWVLLMSLLQSKADGNTLLNNGFAGVSSL